MLVFRIDRIPETGIDLNESLDPQWASALAGSQFHSPGHKVDVSFNMTRNGENVLLSANVKTQLDFICSRCAEECIYDVNFNLTHLFVKGDPSLIKIPSGRENIDSGSMSISYYDAAEIDIEPVLSEEFILSLPSYPLCREECRGVCQFCGKNLNQNTCSCRDKTTDSRWDKLKEIRIAGAKKQRKKNR
jgi:uncharacterized protein